MNSTSSLFEVFTGFNFLYSLADKNTFASILNTRIIKPYDKSQEYIETIDEEIVFYSQSTIQLEEQIFSLQQKKCDDFKSLKDNVSSLKGLIFTLQNELKSNIKNTSNKIELARKESIRVLDNDFSYISLYFAFFSIQVLYIIPTTNNHRILSLLFLEIVTVLILLAIVYRKRIEGLSFKKNIFGLFSMELNFFVNIFLFRISTWRNFSHMNIVLLFFRVTLACFVFHFIMLKCLGEIDSSLSTIFLDIKSSSHFNRELLNTCIIIIATLIPISHFIYITIVAILKNIGYQLRIWFQAYVSGKKSLRIIRRNYDRLSDEFYRMSETN